jgi:hypothetical protein
MNIKEIPLNHWAEISMEEAKAVKPAHSVTIISATGNTLAAINPTNRDDVALANNNGWALVNGFLVGWSPTGGVIKWEPPFWKTIKPAEGGTVTPTIPHGKVYLSNGDSVLILVGESIAYGYRLGELKTEIRRRR